MDPTELTSQPDDVTEFPYKHKQFVLQESKEEKQVFQCTFEYNVTSVWTTSKIYDSIFYDILAKPDIMSKVVYDWSTYWLYKSWTKRTFGAKYCVFHVQIIKC